MFNWIKKLFKLKMQSKTCFLVIYHYLVNGMYCERFCDNPSLDSALTVDSHTYIFRDKHHWIFRPNNSYMSNHSVLISETFKANNSYDMTSLKVIDVIFWTPVLNNGKIDSSIKLLYIFHKSLYFFMKISTCTNEWKGKECIVMLTPSDGHSVPLGWIYWGGKLSDWFPKSIDSTLRVNNTLLLFHGSSVRLIKLNLDKPENVNKSWPSDEKVEIPFDGSLKFISKIDAIFEIPLTEDIVITSGLKYCRFNRKQIDINQKTFNITCSWKQTKYLFYCEKSEEVIIGTTEWITDWEIDSKETYIENKKKKFNNYLVVITVIIFLAFILIIMALIIGFAYYLAQKKHYTTNDSLSEEQSRGISRGISSIVTVNSTSGQRLHSAN